MLSINSLRLRLLASWVTPGYLILTMGSGWAFQGSERVVNQRKNASNEPVKIVSIIANQKNLRLDESFSSGDEWLHGTQLTLGNDSNKDIVYIEVRLGFPETRASGNEMVFPLELGNMPGVPAYRDQLLLHPGEQATLTLSDKEYEGLKAFIGNRHKLSDLHRLQLEVAFIVFADDTAWQSGVLMKRHPTKPRAWISAN